MGSLTSVWVGTAFWGGGELNLMVFLLFLPATGIEDLHFCFVGCGFIGDSISCRKGKPGSSSTSMQAWHPQTQMILRLWVMTEGRQPSS